MRQYNNREYTEGTDYAGSEGRDPDDLDEREPDEDQHEGLSHRERADQAFERFSERVKKKAALRKAYAAQPKTPDQIEAAVWADYLRAKERRLNSLPGLTTFTRADLQPILAALDSVAMLGDGEFGTRFVDRPIGRQAYVEASWTALAPQLRGAIYEGSYRSLVAGKTPLRVRVTSDTELLALWQQGQREAAREAAKPTPHEEDYFKGDTYDEMDYFEDDDDGGDCQDDEPEPHRTSPLDAYEPREYDLVILRIGRLATRNKKATELVRHALLARESVGAAIMVTSERPYGPRHPRYSEALAMQFRHYQVQL